jgi:hypothetical protein
MLNGTPRTTSPRQRAYLTGWAANVMQTVEAGVLYFALVFGAGFALGTIRTLWVVPRLGTRKAELMEAPIMLVVTIVAARWVVLRFALPPLPSARFGFAVSPFENISLPVTLCRELSIT